MAGFRDIVAALRSATSATSRRHDAALDAGAAYKEFFGDMHYAFDHKGIHFIALDNVSDRVRRSATRSSNG